MQLKPFVFLDAFDVEAAGAPRFGMHPHSGIATFSALISGRFSYEDTTGKSGVLKSDTPRWLNEQPNRARIIAVAQTQPRHGGGGALYVLLKRQRGSAP